MSDWIFNLIISYYLSINIVFLGLMLAAVFTIRKDMRIRPLIESLRDKFPSFAPSISILAPAYNEEATIVDSINSFLLLNYPNFEIIVINDGSKDNTLRKIIDYFKLYPVLLPYDDALSRTPINQTYHSHLHPNLTVVDKVNGGKADALNVGLGFSRNEIFCAVDSDSLLEEDALLKIVLPFLERPDETIASGGTIRIANGAVVRFGRVEQVALPKNYFLLMQIIEYTRAFLCGRIGWNCVNSTLVISGAFGLFSKKAVQEVGGYTTNSIGEDMELVVRLHRHFRERKRKYAIVFIPDPVCWTEAPESFSSLQKQRDRWQRGLADTLFIHRSVLFNPRYGFMGMLAFPYFYFVELFGPVIEIFAMVGIAILALNGRLDSRMLLLFFLVGILYGSILSMSALIIEEIYFSKYGKIRQFLTLFLVSMIEVFGYRQITQFWRLMGLFKYLKGDKSWGHLKRTGFGS
ncbi:MAG: glycosyltransferase family 2 protein [Bdellovibrionales bacterium]|nr:glycosyltransferase family 2 protein [Oligoflexia bacterium]